MPAQHILVVDDSPTQLRQLQLILEEGNYETRVAADGQQALEMILKDRPLLVVTDLRMPNMNGLELVAAARKYIPNLPVILTTSQGSEDIAEQALQKGAASFVPKSHLTACLVDTVRQVLSVTEPVDLQQEVAKFISTSSVELCLTNDESLVPGVITRLEQDLVELNLFDEGQRMQISMALDEALLNAMIHGNLEVDSSLREVDDGKPFTEAIRRRKSEKPYCDRRVFVSAHISRTEARFVIRDEGGGFDTSQLSDPTHPDNLEKIGGRGLYLINAFMDDVSHNEVGNEIRMLKYSHQGGENHGEDHG